MQPVIVWAQKKPGVTIDGARGGGVLVCVRARARARACVRACVRVSTGAGTKANTLELVREAGGLLERSQRRIALQSLGERSSSFAPELVALQTASTGVKESESQLESQWALTEG